MPNRSKNRQSCIGVIAGLAALYPAAQPIDEVGLGPVDVVEGLDHITDPSQISTIDDLGITMLRRYYGRPGIYVHHARMAVETGVGGHRSDYTYLERRRVMDAACRAVRHAQLPYVNSAVVATVDGGDPTLQLAAEGALKEMRRLTMISDFRVEVSAENNLQTEKVTTKLELVPLGKRVTLQGEVVFTQPFADESEEEA